ncbi:phosphotransferase family protein [Paenibacillus glycanilyticus]|uniref:Aminoglycoside phosphotransferase domain-containing protein n=1 Tax=Paenibacillus glycanilyticus TaxID=126569 RepID=A0ABQ6GAT8_9BACL|nr:aminoglycoside phosphotransferase family protein [Paenibacillus glycanilyticus]GLX68008.1 hypothetical protein MU1_23530 [Paenibacillus glycanilyticus]
MTAYEKPEVAMNDIESLLRSQLGPGAVEITPMDGGNMSNVYSFRIADQGFVVKFSDLDGAYATDQFVSNLLSGHDIPFPRCLASGQFGLLNYIIMERMQGHNLSECSMEEQEQQLPELFRLLTNLANVDIRSTNGYGWIGSDGNGAYGSWRDFVAAAYAEDQTGTFWENWHDLFQTTFLERDIFEEVYNRLMSWLTYNESNRSFVHGDFHQWNVLSDGTRITGIIDGNCMYGDPVVDLAVLDRHMPWMGMIETYENYLAKENIVIPYLRERLIGAYYYKGLDGLRFYAKMGWKDAYDETRAFLLNLKSY